MSQTPGGLCPDPTEVEPSGRLREDYVEAGVARLHYVEGGDGTLMVGSRSAR